MSVTSFHDVSSHEGGVALTSQIGAHNGLQFKRRDYKFCII